MADNFPREMQTLEEKRLATPAMKLVTTVFILATLTGITAGVYGLMIGHNQAYGVSQDVPWGIITSSFAFVANMATGLCLVAVISQAYGVTTLAPVGPRAVYLAIVSIVASFMFFSLWVESPWRFFLHNATSPNLTSNIWWMTTLYGIMSGCLFLKFSLQISNQRGWAIALGIVAAVAGVGANNNLGGLFTLAADPPIWYGFQLLILFLASAVMSGIAAIIIFTDYAYVIRKQKISGESLKAMHAAGTILALTLAIILVISIARFSAMFYSDSPDPGKTAALALLQGPLFFNFWIMEVCVGIVVPLVILIATKINELRQITLAAALALIGSFFQKYDLVVAGQIVPKLSGWNTEVIYLHYFPTLAEFTVVFGGISLIVAGFLLGERFIGKLFRYY